MRNSILYIVCFALSFFLRIIVINQSKGANEDIDLKIYRDAGQLVVNGINPYDFTDNVELRNKLRLDNDNYHEWLSFDQDRWNSFADSNLPLATLFFGAVEYFFPHPKPWRLIFALFDSILAVLVLAFVLNKWSFESSKTNSTTRHLNKYFPLIIGLLLGLFCPIMLLWGTRIPEHKGMGLLLILSAIYFSDSRKKNLSMLLSPVLLGCSVSFIGLGVFISPICAYNIYKNNNLKFLLLYSSIALISSIVWLVPFLPELLTMMSQRATAGGVPQFGSMWLPIYNLTPEKWILVKNIFSGIFIGINLVGFFRGRLNVIILSASLLFLFTCIYLIGGSMDRMNIALLSLILLLGYSKFTKWASVLAIVYSIYGIFAYFYTAKVEHRQDFDGYFVILFAAIYLTFLIIQSFSSQLTSEIKYRNTSI